MPHMHFLRAFSVIGVLAFLHAYSDAQSRMYFFDNKPAFQKASERVRTVDFESVAPAKGFGKYAPGVGLNVGAIAFRTSGGSRFGAGTIYVPSANYIALNPGLKMVDGAHLSWGAPNQPGNAHLDLTFREGVRAASADIWTTQPVVSPIEITVATRDGEKYTSTVTTSKRPESIFVGFVSESEIVSIRFTLAKGQTSLLLDNLAYGQNAAGADLAALSVTRDASATTSTETGIRIEPRNPSPRTSAVTENPASAEPDNAPVKSPSPAGELPGTGPIAGKIAYVRGGTEIRLISPDGSGDRRLWTHADVHEGLGIYELAWRPDGGELAFSSGHEGVASFYHADIFSVKADGTGLRRITNGPDRSEYPKYGKGTVTVTVRNEQPIYQTTQASTGVFFVYVIGADLPQPVTLPPGSARTLTFKNVADFGDHAQAVVAVYGATRWFIPGTDVKAGRTVKAPDFAISGNGLELFGAFRPVWKRDGSRISYRSGMCVVSSASSRSSVGHVFDPLFKGERTPAPCAWDWGPTADQLLYSVATDEEFAIYRLSGPTGEHPGEKLAAFSKDKYQFINDLRWLPDGTGFLFSAADLTQGTGNILRYDLATRRATPVTDLDDTFAKAFSISPDGRWIVFERTKGFVDDEADLWIVGVDGKGMRLLAKDANHPSWGR